MLLGFPTWCHFEMEWFTCMHKEEQCSKLTNACMDDDFFVWRCYWKLLYPKNIFLMSVYIDLVIWMSSNNWINFDGSRSWHEGVDTPVRAVGQRLHVGQWRGGHVRRWAPEDGVSCCEPWMCSSSSCSALKWKFFQRLGFIKNSDRSSNNIYSSVLGYIGLC
jgi:hypothetical protein